MTSGDLADNSVTNSKLDAGAVSTDKISAGAVTEAKLADGVLPYYAAPQFVAPTTLSLVRGRGATQTGTQRVGPGNYRVPFTRDLSACTLFPTLADANYSVDPGLPFAREIVAGVDNANTARAFVRTYDAIGADTDSDFTIQALC